MKVRVTFEIDLPKDMEDDPSEEYVWQTINEWDGSLGRICLDENESRYMTVKKENIDG